MNQRQGTEDRKTMPLAPLEDEIAAALERRRAVDIPEGFAARVIGRLPLERPVSSARYGSILELGHGAPHRGRIAGFVSLAAIALALLLLAAGNPAALEAGKGFSVVLEVMLVGELLAVGLWLGLERGA